MHLYGQKKIKKATKVWFNILDEKKNNFLDKFNHKIVSVGDLKKIRFFSKKKINYVSWKF